MNITITLSEEEVKCLENDLLDIQKWVEDSLDNKIHNCRKRILQEWLPKLIQDPEVSSIPASESEILTQVMAHKNYKNRLQRDNEMKSV